MSHTPGPWTYDDSRDGCCWNVGCTSNGCHESHPTGIFVVDGPEYDHENGRAYGLAFTSEADARLIASAPDLLEALQKIEKLTTPDDWLELPRIKDLARAAIAKATQ